MASGNNAQEVTGTQTTGSSNPMVQNTLNSLLGGIDKTLAAGPTPQFSKGDWVGVGKTTGQSWQDGIAAARNPGYAAGNRSAMDYTRGLIDNADQPGLYESTMMGTARGDNLNGQDPAFNRDLTRSLDTAGAGVNASIGAGGRFGSGAHVDTLGRTLAGVSDSALLGERRYQNDRQQQALTGIGGERQQTVGNAMGAASALPGQFQASLLPSQTLGAIGSAQDANQTAARASARDLFDRQNGNTVDWLGKLSSILGGAAPIGGSTTTQTQPQAPWWQTALGTAATGAGIAGNFFR